jgi:hypothetical protein
MLASMKANQIVSLVCGLTGKLTQRWSEQAATPSHPYAFGRLPGFPANEFGGGDANRLAVGLDHALRRLAHTLNKGAIFGKVAGQGDLT